MHHGLLFFLPPYKEKTKLELPSLREASWYAERGCQMLESFFVTGFSLGLDFAHAISSNFYF